jgi:hypothetical protein
MTSLHVEDAGRGPAAMHALMVAARMAFVIVKVDDGTCDQFLKHVDISRNYVQDLTPPAKCDR